MLDPLVIEDETNFAVSQQTEPFSVTEAARGRSRRHSFTLVRRRRFTFNNRTWLLLIAPQHIADLLTGKTAPCSWACFGRRWQCPVSCPFRSSLSSQCASPGGAEAGQARVLRQDFGEDCERVSSCSCFWVAWEVLSVLRKTVRKPGKEAHSASKMAGSECQVMTVSRRRGWSGRTCGLRCPWDWRSSRRCPRRSVTDGKNEWLRV